MRRPDSLPTQLFLLALDPTKGRLTQRTELGFTLRAAALVDLQLSGHLVDRDGRPGATDGASTGDRVLDAVLREVAAEAGRRWAYWVRRQSGRVIGAVRDQLVAERRIELRPYRILGLFPAQRIVLRDPFARDRVVGAIDAALGDGWPVGDRTAALVALAATAGMRAALPRARRWAHRQRIAQLTARSGPVPRALRAVLRAGG